MILQAFVRSLFLSNSKINSSASRPRLLCSSCCLSNCSNVNLLLRFLICDEKSDSYVSDIPMSPFSSLSRAPAIVKKFLIAAYANGNADRFMLICPLSTSKPVLSESNIPSSVSFEMQDLTSVSIILLPSNNFSSLSRSVTIMLSSENSTYSKYSRNAKAPLQFMFNPFSKEERFTTSFLLMEFLLDSIETRKSSPSIFPIELHRFSSINIFCN
ncbi:hypothetical protein CHCC20442_4231 [Bacillus licheniformis]|nr:hypothetical protein CHCC20442_4231 [Bacillus licheniformis]